MFTTRKISALNRAIDYRPLYWLNKKVLKKRTMVYYIRIVYMVTILWSLLMNPVLVAILDV